jgi:hypothetical protein
LSSIGEPKVNLKTEFFVQYPHGVARPQGSWEMPAQPLVLNHLDRQAFAHYAQRLGKALAPALAGSRP